MAKITTPIQLSAAFDVDPAELADIGIVDVSLNVDALLFIDPLLLPLSRHAEMQHAAVRFSDYFGGLVKVIAAIKELDTEDLAYRTAIVRLTFPEIKGTCLGYGAGSISGSGIGPDLAARLTATAKQIVDLGILDPDLFLLLPLLEDDVGPDLISDMSTNVILPDLVGISQQVAKRLRITLDKHTIKGITYDLPTNTTQKNPTPLILVPDDVLRALPIAIDWDDVGRAAAENQVIRDRFNAHIADIWKTKTREDKHHMRELLLSSPEAFESYLKAVQSVKPVPYDIKADPAGEFRWRILREHIARDHPINTPFKNKAKTLEEVLVVVRRILAQFQHLIEQRGLWRELWANPGVPRREKSAQRLFFAVADSYCEAFDVDISPEVDTGSGEIDFKLSAGYDARVVVEIKLSDNKRLTHGYEKQLEKYKAAEKTTAGFYVVLIISDLGSKDEQLVEIKNAAAKVGTFVSELVFVDGLPKESASVV